MNEAGHSREELSNSAKSDATLSVDQSGQNEDNCQFTQSISICSNQQAFVKDSSLTSSHTSSGYHDKDDTTPSRQIGESGHQMSLLFRQELLNVCQVKTDSRIGIEVAKLSDPDLDIVQLLGRCLPHIVPNISLAKREVSTVDEWLSPLPIF